jgi:hypothetical protein
MSHELPEKFGEADLQRVRDIINVNIVAVNELTRVALPSLLKNQAANLRGLIVNVGSASGLLPTPLLACYGASKAYLSSFSSALQREYGKAGVDVDCAVAFFVVSNMSKRKYATAMIPTPEAFVRQSLAKVCLFVCLGRVLPSHAFPTLRIGRLWRCFVRAVLYARAGGVCDSAPAGVADADGGRSESRDAPGHSSTCARKGIEIKPRFDDLRINFFIHRRFDFRDVFSLQETVCCRRL